MNDFNVVLRAGDSLLVQVAVTDRDNNSINLTNAYIRYVADTPDLLLKSTLTGGIVIIDAGLGEFEIELEQADTVDIQRQLVVPHECKVHLMTGEVLTVFSGNLKIAPTLIGAIP